MGSRRKTNCGWEASVRQVQLLLPQLDGSRVFGLAEGLLAVQGLLLAGFGLDLLHLLLDYLQLSRNVASADHEELGLVFCLWRREGDVDNSLMLMTIGV